jgi:hypothetical protein
MPSHFHSTAQSSRLPSESGGSSSGEARKNGYGCEPAGRWRPVAHQPGRDDGAVGSGRLGEAADDERLRNADAKFAGQQLVQDEPFEPRQAKPPSCDRRALIGGVQARERQQSFLDPGRQRRVRFRLPAIDLIEDQGDQLRTVADCGVTLCQQPLREPRQFHRPGAKQRGRHQPLEPATRQKVDGPRRVGRRGFAKVGGEGGDLGVGRRRAIDRVIERCETSHDDSADPAVSSPVSPSKRVAIVPVSSPRSASCRARTSDQPWVTSTRAAPVSAIVSSSPRRSA